MYVFIFLGKKDNFGVFEEIFGDFWDCDDYVGREELSDAERRDGESHSSPLCCLFTNNSHAPTRLAQ